MSLDERVYWNRLHWEDNPLAELKRQTESGRLTGTFVMHSHNGGVYYSPVFWHSPADGLLQQSSKWVYVSSPGWYGGIDKSLAQEVRALVGENWPQYPGECALFDPQLALDLDDTDDSLNPAQQRNLWRDASDKYNK